MTKKLRVVVVVSLVQYGAVALSVCWANLEVQHALWVPQPGLEFGITSLLMFGIEGVRSLRPARRSPAGLAASLSSFALFFYCGTLMWMDPFMNGEDDARVLIQLTLLLPVLLANHALVRWRAWLAVAASVLFFATSFAMLAHYAGCRGGVNGFFTRFIH
jgi:hypothetical protein